MGVAAEGPVGRTLITNEGNSFVHNGMVHYNSNSEIKENTGNFSGQYHGQIIKNFDNDSQTMLMQNSSKHQTKFLENYPNED